MPELVIVGGGDHARVALETARASGWNVPLFVDLGGGASRETAGLPVARDLAEVAADDRRFVVAIGRNAIRAELFERALAAGGRPATLVHPSAVLLAGATIGEGSHICAGVIVGVDAAIGRNVIVNTSASIDHDDRIDDHAFLGPGCHLGGRVTVGAGAHIGLGSSIIEGRRIGAWSLVAAGAAVVSDIPDAVRVAGVPAKRMDGASGEGSTDD